MKSVKYLKNIIVNLLVLFFSVLVVFPVSAQNYEFSLNPRRAFDQIIVEIWAKSLNTSVAPLGNASLVIKYNTSFLYPSLAQNITSTDTISKFDAATTTSPIRTIQSEFNNTNGYSLLTSTSYSAGFYSLEINHSVLNELGLVPSSTGRGSFIGKLTFDIIGNPSETDLANISWSKNNFPGELRIFDSKGNDIKSKCNFIDVNANFTVVGVSFLSPIFNKMVIDRDASYLFLTGEYANSGYPVYFERSVNPNLYSSPTAKPIVVDESLAYLLEYSIDNGMNWQELGRAAETEKASSVLSKGAGITYYKSGEIYTPEKSNSTYILSTQSGGQINPDSYRQPLRLIISKNLHFISRSEQARLKITILTKDLSSPLTDRLPTNIYNISNSPLVLGRLFFNQLNGVSQYIKSSESYSNSTQLTVSAWVNLNSYPTVVGAEPAIVASSAGGDARPSFGSNEGAWMLYLKNGRIPAFRAREILNRGSAGSENYIGICESYSLDSISIALANEPLSEVHADNWTHLAATVKDNTISLYVNGSLVSQVTNNNANDIRMMITDHPIWIGVNPNISANTNNTTTPNITAGRYLNAGIKEVQVWRTALSQEQIRAYASGIAFPDSINNYDDIKKALEIYYTLEGNLGDIASNTTYQKGRNNAVFYDDNAPANSNNILNFHSNNILKNVLFIDNRESVPTYRPDRPHIVVSSPSAGSGVLNKQNDNTVIGWLAYGLGDITKSNSKDLEIQYTIDNGDSWHYVKNPAGNELTGQFSPDAEAGQALWQPYLNNNPAANLRSLSPYSKTAKIRISGTEANEQASLYAVSKSFSIAPYFSINTTQGSIMQISPNEGMNITGNYAYIESWIKPYRFATSEEVYLPLVEKASAGPDGSLHYSFGLMEDGRLLFIVRDSSGRDYIASSSKEHTVASPNIWTHVGVLFIKKNSSGLSEARFYIDGVVENPNTTSTNFTTAVELNITNTYPLFIGYKPGNLLGTSRSFIGEFKEIRFWNALPNNLSISGDEPTPLTIFIQAAQAANTSNLSNAYKLNLHSAFSMDGGTFNINGNGRAVSISENNGAILHNYGVPPTFFPFHPFFKLVEPTFRQFVSNSDTNVRLRWVGLYYDALNFSTGTAKTTPPSIEYSIRGGGGNIIQPYQYVGSLYWSGNKMQSLKLLDTEAYLSKLTGPGNDRYVALSMNAAIADPDVNKDGVFNDQGPLSPSLTNARLRLTGSYTINNEKIVLQSEGPLFTITPTDNFTVRVMLEGYHNGNVAGKLANNIGTSYDQGGLKIQLYNNLSGELGNKVGNPAESIYGFSDRDPVNLYKNKMNFGNAKFVFTDVPDGNYWLLVEHINHLSIMSRYPSPFFFTGDVATTLAVESGWDFLTWDGVDHNVMPKPDIMPWTGRYYTARGTAVNNKNDIDNYVTTGLIYNGGASLATAGLPAMVGGDVNQDRMINAADRVIVRQEAGFISPRSDVTGDKYVNAIDRTIVDRNFGRVSSLYNISIPQSIRRNPKEINIYSGIAKEDTTLSVFFNRVAYLTDSINSNSNSNKKFSPTKTKNTLLGIAYDVSAETNFDPENKYVDLSIYITNRSEVFAPANCTFAVEFNPESLSFSALVGADSVLFNSDFDFNNLPNKLPKTGYLKLKSAPLSNSNSNIYNYNSIRTIEIDYDAYSNLPGINLTNNKTYLGTLRFKVNSSAGVIAFSWHESKAVLTTTGNNITDYGNWKPIEPTLLYSASVLSPNGGEKYSQNKKQKISWIATSLANIYLELSTNAGISWSRITDTSISSKLLNYDWTTPNYSSTSCLVRIVDAETGIEMDRSDSAFSIVAPYGYIINPYVSNEAFKGGSKSSIEWYAEGSDCVYFEFSSDGGITWTPVAGKYASNTIKISWNFPKITTRQAIIRMLDCENNMEIARTGQFKILNGSMTITYPRAKELVTANKIFKVRWTQQSLDEFDLDLSIDNGTSWSRVATNILAGDNYLDWLPPDVNTDEAIFRTIYKNDTTMEYCRSKVFRIKSNNTVIQDNIFSGFKVGQVYPNPSTGTIYLDIITSENIYLNLEIVNLAGSTVKTIYNNRYFEIGKQQISINISDLFSGKYFIVLRKGKTSIFRELIIK